MDAKFSTFNQPKKDSMCDDYFPCKRLGYIRKICLYLVFSFLVFLCWKKTCDISWEKSHNVRCIFMSEYYILTHIHFGFNLTGRSLKWWEIFLEWVGSRVIVFRGCGSDMTICTIKTFLLWNIAPSNLSFITQFNLANK